MGYFPFMVDIEGKNCLVVGGGKVAAHKIKKLIPFKPMIRVVAPHVTEQLITIVTEYKNLEMVKRQEAALEDIEWADFVIAASNDKGVNKWVGDVCHGRSIPVNVVDCKEACSFIFPSIIHNGDLTIGVSTAGASPEIAAAIKNEAAEFIPSNMDGILDYLSSIRALAKEKLPEDEKRARFLKDMARECMEKNGVFSNEETLFRLSTYTDEGKITLGRVSLVGAGCGCYDLITLKGVAAVRNAEVLVYDDLIDDRLLDFSSESCEKLYVGKRSGRHSMGQEEICRLLLDKAREGKYVVRLKGGDPFVFGRASEEIETLRKNNIEYDYIPGITSAVAVPGMAGIPVTSRGISRSFHVITGHTKNTTASIPEDMAAIARLNGTLVFLMGIENIHKITDALIENGKDKDTPSAVIHADIDNNTDIIRAKLSRIAEVVQANPIKPPAVIVVGEVVDGFAND